MPAKTTKTEPSSPSVENRKDLLLLLLYAPGSGRKIGEPVKGRTRITKLMFLFAMEFWKKYGFDQLVRKESLPQFIRYHYGPFSQEIINDIEFFKNIGFLESTGSDESLEPELEEAAELQRQLAIFDEEAVGNVSYEAEKFELSAKGREFTKKLYNALSDSQKRALTELKTRYGSAPLAALIRYVYKRYPEYKSSSLSP